MGATLYIDHLKKIETVANELLKRIGKHKRVAFYGEMGAGKTTLIRAICRNLGVVEEPVSPTFTLINEYHTTHGEKIYHMDFYRINDIEEIYDLGYEEYFYEDAYCFIEWPEKMEGILPVNVVPVRIYVESEEVRKIEFNL